MTNLSRRKFLKVGGAVAATGTALAGSGSVTAEKGVAPGATTLPYPRAGIAKVRDLPSNQPVTFHYPDPESPCQLLKTGRPIPGGVGPEEDMVAYSILCTHMGCPLAYDRQARTYKCDCHFSIFDPEMHGQMVDGQATENLPRVLLEYDADDDILYAVAVQGLIYGRQCNVL